MRAPKALTALCCALRVVQGLQSTPHAWVALPPRALARGSTPRSPSLSSNAAERPIPALHGSSDGSGKKVGGGGKHPIGGGCEGTIDIAVVGGGIGGLATALHLLKRGMKVKVVGAQGLEMLLGTLFCGHFH